MNTILPADELREIRKTLEKRHASIPFTINENFHKVLRHHDAVIERLEWIAKFYASRKESWRDQSATAREEGELERARNLNARSHSYRMAEEMLQTLLNELRGDAILEERP